MPFLIILALLFVAWLVAKALGSSASNLSAPSPRSADDPATADLVESYRKRATPEVTHQPAPALARGHYEVTRFPRVTGPSLRLAAILDVETTGLSRKDEIIEMAIILFAFHPESHAIQGVVDSYCGRREPSVPINPYAAAVNGFTLHDLKGHRLDESKVISMIERAEFLIAHNMAFDSRFVRQPFPAADSKEWVCSMRGIDWRGHGFERRALAYLLEQHGISGDSHRAGADTELALLLLSQRAAGADATYFTELVHRHKPEPSKAVRGSARKVAASVGTQMPQMSSLDPDRLVALDLNIHLRRVRDTNEAVGVLRGLLADNYLSIDEILFLGKWLAYNHGLADEWPFTELMGRVQVVLKDDRIEEDERQDLQDIIQRFLISGSPEEFSSDRPTTFPLTSPAPKIVFGGREFVLTGKFAHGARARCHAEIETRGGICHDTVRLSTCYLVIGAFSSRDWANTSRGRKIEKAAEYAGRSGIAIVDEKHWAAHL